METEQRFIVLKNKVAELIIPEWEWSLNIDEILTIQYDNIMGEVLTIPVLENRVGRLYSEMKEYKKKLSLRLEMKEAELRKLFRKQCSVDGMKRPTIEECQDHLLSDPVIKNKRLELISTEKLVEDLEIFYDAVKSKAFKLNNLSKSLHPEDYEKELIEGRVNNVLIKIREKRFS